MTYRRLASALHAASAGVAAAWRLALVTAALLTEHPLLLLALGAIALAGAAGARVGRRVAGMLRFALPFGVLIAGVNALVVREGLTVVWRFGEVPAFGRIDITLEALAYGGLLGLRAVVVLLACALLSATVDPDQVLRGLRRVSFRSALTAALAVRLVPVLQRDGRRLAEARRCRVDEPGRVAVLRAVAAGALDRAGDVAATLEVRGYRTSAPVRGRAPAAPWSRHDVAFAASAVALAAVALAVAAGGWERFEAYPRTVAPLDGALLALVVALAGCALAPFADRRGIE